MKKIAIIFSLLAVFTVAGCGSSEPAKNAAPPSSSSTASTEAKPAQASAPEKTIVKETIEGRKKIIEYSDGTVKKTYLTISESLEQDKKNGKPPAQIGHFKSRTEN